MWWRWPHFSFKEIFHSNLHLEDVTEEVLENIAVTLDKLEVLRSDVKTAITVTSFFRDTARNKKVGGVSNSYHKKGMAVDIHAKHMELHQLARLASYYFNGVIVYPDRGFIHVDCRDKVFTGQNVAGVLVPIDLSKF